MNQEKYFAVMYDIHADLARQGPGSNESTAKAFYMAGDLLPDNPRILDIACGTGAQTLELAFRSSGRITAVDIHQPYLDKLEAQARTEGLAKAITTRQADMASLPFKRGSFDLVWSEGGAYFMGFDNAVKAWGELVDRDGFLVLTELSWLEHDAPEEVRAFWGTAHPTMRHVDDNLETLRNAGYSVYGHFALSESDWWTEFYTPLENRLPGLQAKYAGDPEGRSLVEATQTEIDLFREHADVYGSMFYVARKSR